MSDVLDAARNKEWDEVQVRRPLEVFAPLEAFRTSSVAHRAPNGYDTFLVSPESAQNLPGRSVHCPLPSRLCPCSNNCVAYRAWRVSADTTSTSKTGALPCQRVTFSGLFSSPFACHPVVLPKFWWFRVMRRHVRRAVCVPEYDQYPQVP